jgi:hypothetical protein
LAEDLPQQSGILGCTLGWNEMSDVRIPHKIWMHESGS